jgi:hypothetical protein
MCEGIDAQFYGRLYRIGKGAMTAEDERYWSGPAFVFDESEWSGVPYTLLTTQVKDAQSESAVKISSVPGPWVKFYLAMAV